MQKPQKVRAPWNALERLSLALDLVLGSLFMFMFLVPAGDKERTLLLIVGLLGLLFLVNIGALSLRQIRLAATGHAAVALALLVLGAIHAWNTLTSGDRFVQQPGLMLVASLLGFAGLYGWLASRGLKSP